MSKVFLYELTQEQYLRFQASDTLNELQDLGKSFDVLVIGLGDLVWSFEGAAAGYAWVAVLPVIGYVCIVNVEKKPWWVPWFLVDRGFRKQLV